MNGGEQRSASLRGAYFERSAYGGREEMAEDLRHALDEFGIALVRGVDLGDIRALAAWGRLFFEDPVIYKGGTIARVHYGDGVYDTGTEPPFVRLYHHNEMSYLSRYPLYVVFGCASAPARGAPTVVGDNLAVTKAIEVTPLGEKLRREGVTYIRTLTDRDRSKGPVYKHWQDAMYTDSRAEVEALAREEGWTTAWDTDGSLRISYVADAFERCERLGRDLLFFPIGFHGMYFDLWPEFAGLPLHRRPLHLTFGDGSPFSAAEVAQVVDLYERHAFPIDWRSGDIAILDNERWTHSRPPFELAAGDVRRVAITMGELTMRHGQQARVSEPLDKPGPETMRR